MCFYNWSHLQTCLGIKQCLKHYKQLVQTSTILDLYVKRLFLHIRSHKIIVSYGIRIMLGVLTLLGMFLFLLKHEIIVFCGLYKYYTILNV